MKIKIKKIENGIIPEYKTSGAAGADCYARISEKVIVKPRTVETIPLGFAVELPEGFEMQIRGRSGLARKNNVEVFNSPGTIDSDYRGEVSAILFNASEDEFIVNPNDRIAQAVVAPIIQAAWVEVNELTETKRGEGGFGSTGVKRNQEPFSNLEDAEKYLGKPVLIDGKKSGKVYRVELEEYHGLNTIFCEFVVGDFEIERLSASEAFQRVTIDGKKFGVGI